MIFSYVSTKELARSLVVSKHWQSAILSSIVLRRKLLLNFDPKHEYLSYGTGASRGDNRQSPDLSNQPTLTRINRLIHEPHSALLSYSKSDLSFDLEITDIPYEALRSVHPATFLFQPPLNDVQLYCEGYKVGPVGTILRREGGVTFGEVLEEIDEMHKLRVWGDGGPRDVCTLCHTRVIASNAKVVVDARAARARAQASAGLGLLE